MAIFGDFFASCVFSEPRAAGFRPASDDQGDNPGQENRGLDGVLYKL